jgi:hypothetical protein
MKITGILQLQDATKRHSMDQIVQKLDELIQQPPFNGGNDPIICHDDGRQRLM